MFKTLILKEIQETIQTYRFLIATLLCLVLIPLGMYVTLKDYEQRLTEYRTSVNQYHERAEIKIRKGWISIYPFEGYRPPSPLSVFSLGIGNSLPYRVMTARNGQFTIEHQTRNGMPQSDLFGKVDFVFIVSFVLSLLALIFTFSSISGEKERGTIRLIVSNSIPGWHILMAKIIGNFLTFLMPFMVSLLFGLLILNGSGSFALFSGRIFFTILTIVGITLLFIFSLFILGVLVSIRAGSSFTSIVTLLFIWVLSALVIPKISPMIARSLFPIKAQQVIDTEIQITRENLERELDRYERELFERVLADNGLDGQTYFEKRLSRTEEGKKVQSAYDEAVLPLQEEYRERIVSETAKIESDYENKRNIQNAIAVNLSRISPVSCFTYLLSELSGTGVLEKKNFIEHARQFQDKVKAEIYDMYTFKSYGITDGMTNQGYYRKNGFNSENVPVPHMSNYRTVTLDQVMKAEWVDILFLALYAILFFAASFVSFLRYDVR